MIGIWTQAIIGLLLGIIPGVTVILWMASPFGPTIPFLSTALARVLLTVSQFIRGKGVLVKRETGEFEIGTYVEDSPNGAIVRVSDDIIEVDPERLTWGLFGKKDFGLTWELGTELHQRMQTQDPLADGGVLGYEVNMAALHRYLRGTNEQGPIDRTEEHAEAQYGDGDHGFGTKMKIAYVVLMLILGIATTWIAMG